VDAIGDLGFMIPAHPHDCDRLNVIQRESERLGLKARQTLHKHELNRWIEQVFLECVDNPIFRKLWKFSVHSLSPLKGDE
jgi:hypothetical protein